MDDKGTVLYSFEVRTVPWACAAEVARISHVARRLTAPKRNPEVGHVLAQKHSTLRLAASSSQGPCWNPGAARSPEMESNRLQ